MEVATMVGGAVLAPLFQPLFDGLKSFDLLTYARESKVLDELNKWEPMLRTIFAVLDNAEEQQVTNQLVQSWFSNLRNLAYDVEDILDEFNTEAMRRKFRARSRASSSKVHKLLCSSVAGLSLCSSVKFSAGMISKMKKISERLGDMITRKDMLKLSGSANGRNNCVKEERLTLPTTSLIDEEQVHGREKDHREILELMMREADDRRISVIPIWGMGGVGKTTLAQLVYNDASLHFDFKAWVFVGEDFDVLTVTKMVLQPHTGDEAKDFNSLQLKLKEKLSRKKFLVVLDDLWSQDYEKWTLFYGPFSEGATGSRIIVTTRHREVSLMTNGGDGYPLQKLSNEDCLSVFAQHALARKNFNEHLHLKEVGEEIVERCDGLPLAAKALGGILRGKQTIRSWEEVLNNRIWEDRGIVLPALKLSYYHLPSILKRCFGYTAIFSKDCELDKTQLVLLWMAEGFIQEMDDGYKYFDDLLARSFIQQSSKNASLFVMHDLINDLARSVSANLCFNLDEETKANKSCSEVRHSGFGCSEYDFARRFEIFNEMNHLRTLLASNHLSFRQKCYLSRTVLEVMIPKLKCLRVLALPYYGIDELPTSIGFLKHLRYLDLSSSQIKILPETLSKLFNLQTLILSRCTELCKLPKDCCNLTNLQCLNIEGTWSLKEMPLHIGNLTKLHTLSKFIVGTIDGCGIEELQKIPNLQGQLQIIGLQNVKNIEDAEHLKMREKNGVVDLILEWFGDFDDFRNERDEQVLIALQPQENITRLSIKSYKGTMFPSWLGDHSFNHMTFLELSYCFKVSSLPPLGQLPSLKDLRIIGMSGIKEVGIDFFGDVSSFCDDVFPSLETLMIDNMRKWKQWSCFDINEDRRQAFPKLKKLRIKCCQKLIGDLPKRLPTLQQLYIDSCPMLEVVPKTLPSLGELEITGCKKVVLKSLRNLKSLTKLKISDVLGLMSIDGVFLEGLASLKLIDIRDCKQLVSLVEGEEGILLPNLRVLHIQNCEKLEKLSNQLHSLTSLTDLKVFGCPKLVTLSKGGLPDRVKCVVVTGCDSLVRLPEGIIVDKNGNSYSRQPSRLEELVIKKGEALITLSNGVFPTSLRTLEMGKGMEAQLLGSLQIQNHLSHLTSLIIEDCWELESFPDKGLPIPTLSSFKLRNCRELRCLPNNIHDLTSLQHVELHHCPEIESFPERGLPPNLTHLWIGKCDKLEKQPLSQWGLNALTCLQALLIHGAMEVVSSFPDDTLPLPTSLTAISINGFQNLKSISSRLQRLTSLQFLVIQRCPKLQYLPKEGLPPSVGCLYISTSPLLKKRYRKGKGDYWPLIAPIPRFEYGWGMQLIFP